MCEGGAQQVDRYLPEGRYKIQNISFTLPTSQCCYGYCNSPLARKPWLPFYFYFGTGISRHWQGKPKAKRIQEVLAPRLSHSTQRNKLKLNREVTFFFFLRIDMASFSECKGTEKHLEEENRRFWYIDIYVGHAELSSNLFMLSSRLILTPDQKCILNLTSYTGQVRKLKTKNYKLWFAFKTNTLKSDIPFRFLCSCQNSWDTCRQTAKWGEREKNISRVVYIPNLVFYCLIPSSDLFHI